MLMTNYLLFGLRQETCSKIIRDEWWVFNHIYAKISTIYFLQQGYAAA